MRLSNSFDFAIFLLLLREKHGVFLLIFLFLLITKVFNKFKRILFDTKIRLGPLKECLSKKSWCCWRDQSPACSSTQTNQWRNKWGGGAGGRVPPKISDREISAYLPEKIREKGKGVKIEKKKE